VDEKVDHGPVILQDGLLVKKSDTLASLEKKIHLLEHRIYPQAISLLISGKCKAPRRKAK
ncbi:MAG: formyltransferase family protein, partial [Candidatus Omnitrophota bacterium]